MKSITTRILLSTTPAQRSDFYANRFKIKGSITVLCKPARYRIAALNFSQVRHRVAIDGQVSDDHAVTVVPGTGVTDRPTHAGE